jgi:hypothetical protein
MSSRVFISYRSSDGTDKATSLARDLDEIFGQAQVFLDKEDLPAGSRWRDEIARTLHGGPILLVLVTPNYLEARDEAGARCIERIDDPVRDELEAAVAANAHIIPLLCDGVAQTPAAADLPAPFDQLAERTWRRLRAYDWREDLARLADDLRGLGILPRPSLVAPDTGPDTVPLPADAPSLALPSPGGSSGRRLALAGTALVILGVGGIAAWRWQKQRAANLSGRWRASIGGRGATSTRYGVVTLFAIVHQGKTIRLSSSAIDVEHDRDWENYRDFWKQQHGEDLKRVFYRGEGELRSDDDPPDDQAASTVPDGLRRIVVPMRIEVPGEAEPIDTGSLRASVDADALRMVGRLWLNSEQAERIVEMRRE